jgi:hypothetical protein
VRRDRGGGKGFLQFYKGQFYFQFQFVLIISVL